MATKKSQQNADRSADMKFMAGITAFFYEAGIGKKRVAILCRQLEKFGGSVSEKFNEQVTHIIMSKTKTLDKLLTMLKVGEVDESVEIVDADWLSACFLQCKLYDVTPYLIKEKESLKISNSRTDTDVHKLKGAVLFQLEKTEGEEMYCKDQESTEDFNKHQSNTIQVKRSSPLKAGRKRRRSGSSEDTDFDSSYEESEDEHSTMTSTLEKIETSPSKPKGVWACIRPSSSNNENLNKHITDKLEVLAKAYTSTQDRWRALGYQKAISTIKSHPKKIETVEEVKGLPFIGDRLAKKIAEILETGHLRRLDHMDPNIEVINMFTAVWGAGPKTAETWIAQVKATACELIPGMEVVTCGSYRRGRQLCGDVDILVSHPDGRSHKGFLLKLIDALQVKGLITDDLITVDNEEQRKYMGVFKLPGASRKHRRLDIIIAPYSELPCALVHFTGSGRLNRSMRQLAKNKNMSLSEHALREGVIRQNQEKIFKGTIIPVHSEEDIFHRLGLDYLQPHERDW